MDINTLTSTYVKEMETLIQMYPGQERNREGYLAWLSRAKVGTVTSDIRTKSGLSFYAKGTKVLYAPDTMPGRYIIWAPSPDGILHKSLCSDSHINGKKIRPDELSEAQFYYLMEIQFLYGFKFYPRHDRTEEALFKKGYLVYLPDGKATLTERGRNYHYETV